MGQTTEGNAQRLEKLNRYLTIGVALLAVSVVLFLILDIG